MADEDGVHVGEAAGRRPRRAPPERPHDMAQDRVGEQARPRYLDENHILYYEINHNNGSESARLFDKTNHTDKLIVAHSGLSSPYTGKVLQGDSLLCLNGDFATIFVYTSDTLIEVARGYDATFSADGKKIVYHDLTHIFLQNIDGTNIQLVYTEQDQNKTVELPQLSPDGKFIIFQTLYSVPTN